MRSQSIGDLQAKEHSTRFKGQMRRLIDGSFEPFSTDNIFMSPAAQYCTDEVYAAPFMYCYSITIKSYLYYTRCMDEETGARYQLQVALQLRVRPDSYSIGQQTIGASDQIHPAFR